MANIRSAASNVLDAVVGTSNAICTTVNLVGQSAQYGSNWMSATLAKQTIAIAADAEIFEQSYAETKAQELAKIRMDVAEWCNRNEQCAQFYETSLGQIREAISRAKAQQKK